jgi:hypothetical protein
MNAKQTLSLWGLKWNPFSPDLPPEALLVTPRIEHFACPGGGLCDDHG